MKKFHLFIVVTLVVFVINENTALAQKKNDVLLQVSADEDYLNYRGKGTDRYYTGGFFLSVYYSGNKKKFLSFLVNPLKSNNNLRFIRVSQIVNTPDKITVPGPILNDYPYVGALFMSYGNISIDSIKNTRLTCSVSAGLIGPYAMGEQVQKYFHRLVGDKQPIGWNSQLNSDVILNYQFQFEKKIASFGNIVEIIGHAEINTGTTFNNSSVGFLLRLGRPANYFTSFETNHFKSKFNRKYRFIYFLKPQIRVVAYNALLQGNIFKKYVRNAVEENYIVKAEDISRFIYKLSFGVKFETKSFGLSISQHMQTREFIYVSSHEYGNISFFFSLKKRKNN